MASLFLGASPPLGQCPSLSLCFLVSLDVFMISLESKMNAMVNKDSTDFLDYLYLYYELGKGIGKRETSLKDRKEVSHNPVINR